MSNPIKIGILGCANIAEKFIIPTLNELNEFEILGLASRTEERANYFSKKFNIHKVYTYEELIELNDIEAVYIPLPNSLHYEWIKKSLNKNLHVLVEKSMASNYKEVLELNNIAKKKKLVLIENFQFRFHSQLNYIKNLVDSGRIGELRNMRSSFGFPPLENDNIRYKRKLGGGALLDAGAYPIKISQIFLGSNIEVITSNIVVPNNKEVDIWGSATLKQINGNLTSQISFGFDNFYQNNIELWGSKGKIFTNRIFTAAPGFEPTIEIETSEGKEIIKLAPDQHFKNILNHFYNTIITKNNVENEYKQNINQSRLLNEVKLIK